MNMWYSLEPFCMRLVLWLYEWLSCYLPLMTHRRVHRLQKHGVRGVSWPPYLKWESKKTIWLPTFNVYKACFAVFGSLWYTINAIHSVHYAHVKLSLTHPYSRRAQQCAAAGFPLPNFREPFVIRSLGQNCTLLAIKTKCIFVSELPILHIKFPKLSGGNTPGCPSREGATPSHNFQIPSAVWPSRKYQILLLTVPKSYQNVSRSVVRHGEQVLERERMLRATDVS